MAGKFGEPQRNTREPPARMTDLESAALYRGDRRVVGVESFDRLWKRFLRCRRKPRGRRREAFLTYREPDLYAEDDDPNGLRRVYDAFTRARDRAEAREVFVNLVRQENEWIAGEFEHQRRRLHRRLRPDPRYDRRRDGPSDEQV